MKSLILFLYLVKLDEIIVEQKDYNRYPFRRHSNVIQIRRILLRQRRRIRKRNRKQINVENNLRIISVLAMINLNLHISTRELQCNLGIPYGGFYKDYINSIPSHHFNPRCK